MDRTQFDLLKTKRFLPLFVTQALGSATLDLEASADFTSTTRIISVALRLAKAGCC